MATDNTKQLGNIHLPRSFAARSEEDKLFYTTALQWFLYPTWTIDEAANLLSGCLPKREMLQPGKLNEALDQKVIETENLIRRELGKSIDSLSSKKYFAPIQVSRDQLMDWALTQKPPLPKILQSAYEAHREQEKKPRYSTPCLEAIEWTSEQYWHDVDYRDPPTKGEIIQALLQRFPDLDHEECIMVEYVCRHPIAREPYLQE
tara:strand:+ start:4387 stop:4998 length:612 start_codon:yes stop_codon:yes gene_type:complete